MTRDTSRDDIARFISSLDPALDPTLVPAFVNLLPQRILETGNCTDRDCIKLRMLTHYYGNGDIAPCPPSHRPRQEQIIIFKRNKS